MARRVLVPLDKTARAEGALAALPVLLSPGDEVLLFSVGEPMQRMQTGIRPGRIIQWELHGTAGSAAGAVTPDRPVYAETTDQVIQRQIDELEDYLRSMIPALEKQGFKVTVAVEISDDPTHAIVDLARRSKATFILMVRSTHRTVGERLFGTVARNIINENVAPVMILPDEPSA
jgi:nucleotide-binding universal stress UspA family protein